MHILCIFYIKYLGRNGFSPAPPVVPTDGHDLWPAITQGFFILKYFIFLLQDLTPLALLLSTTLTWTTRAKRSRCFFLVSLLCKFTRKVDRHRWPPVIWISNSGIPPTDGEKSKVSEVSKNSTQKSSFLLNFWASFSKAINNLLFFQIAIRHHQWKLIWGQTREFRPHKKQVYCQAHYTKNYVLFRHLLSSISARAPFYKQKQLVLKIFLALQSTG